MEGKTEETSEVKQPQKEDKKTENEILPHKTEGTDTQKGGDGEKNSGDRKDDSKVHMETKNDDTSTDHLSEASSKKRGSDKIKSDNVKEGTGEEDATKKTEEDARKKTEEDATKKTEDDAEMKTTTKRKKKGSKTRKVDMNKFYPEELSISGEESKQVREKGEAAEGKFVEEKDYSQRDPSFLDEFFSSEEKLLKVERVWEVGEEDSGVMKEEEVEEEEIQQEIYIQPPDKELSDMIYDQICDLETPISSDESLSVPKFKYIRRRKRHLRNGFGDFAISHSDHSLEAPSTTGMHGMKYLMELVIPNLKKTLIELALYQPQNPVRYMTYSLLHKTKTPPELDLDPDPRIIQALVDGQKKKKKVTPKKPEIFLEPLAESHDALPKMDILTRVLSPKEEDPSHIGRFQRKYKSAKKKLLTEEKEKRSTVSRKDMLPGICLGPTTLPLPPQAVTSAPGQKS